MPIDPIQILISAPVGRVSSTSFFRKARLTTFAPVLFAMLSVPPSALFAQKGQTSASTPGKTVVLTPDSCVSVADGDIILFKWNPAFSTPLEVADLHDFSMVFAPAARSPGKGLVPQGGFELRALPVKATPEIPVPVTDAHNGFLTFSFRAHLRGIEAGQYNLIYAAAHPELSPGSPQALSQMTNSPLRYPFCLEVTSSPVGKK